MNRFEERMAEMAVTDWRGARVIVTVEVPWLNNTMSTQMVIDARMLDILRDINTPKDIELFMEVHPDIGMVELERWKVKKHKAKELAEFISKQIAFQLIEAIEAEGR